MKKLLLLVALAGCSSSKSSYSGPRSTLDEAGALAARQACMFKAGDPAGITVAKDAKLGAEIPIDTIVVLMMENRSFDHLLSNLPSYGQSDVEVASSSASNPDSQGNAVPFHHETSYCFADTDHEWDGSHVEFDNGKNDGFVIANENQSGGGPDGSRAMGFYTEAEIPFLYGAANAFAIGDHYFCSVLGPTFVNREYLYAGTSFGYTYNQILAMPMNNIMEVLETKKIDWHVYSETLPGPAIFLDTYSHYIGDNFFPQSAFFSDAAAGTLPSLTFLDPNLRDDGAIRDDFHPPGDLQLGDALLAKVTAAVTASPQWGHMALIITFDENGGLFDHVPPPKACPPDDTAPITQNGKSTPYGFDQYGFRVPLVVISPWAKPHYVSHNVYDHTSILRFIEARFELGALTGRDANADPLFDLFDFSKAALKTAPSLPPSTPDQTQLTDCTNQFPKGDGGIPGLNPDM
jgi:phospholipase C